MRNAMATRFFTFLRFGGLARNIQDSIGQARQAALQFPVAVPHLPVRKMVIIDRLPQFENQVLAPVS